MNNPSQECDIWLNNEDERLFEPSDSDCDSAPVTPELSAAGVDANETSQTPSNSPSVMSPADVYDTGIIAIRAEMQLSLL